MMTGMRRRRYWPWYRGRAEFSTLVAAGPRDPVCELSAQQRGNVTAIHRQLLASLAPRVGTRWSVRALWACLEELRHSTVTAAPEVRVLNAWVDGSDAFCVVYVPPFGPDRRVGLRRQQDDVDVTTGYGLSSNSYVDWVTSPEYEPAPDDVPDPVAFGVDVAVFDIGEPLGHYTYSLRFAQDGVGWWGSLGPQLPSPHPTP